MNLPLHPHRPHPGWHRWDDHGTWPLASAAASPNGPAPDRSARRSAREWRGPGKSSGDGSKPCTPGEHQNSWDLWMFIQQKMVCIGIDPYPCLIMSYPFLSIFLSINPSPKPKCDQIPIPIHHYPWLANPPLKNLPWWWWFPSTVNILKVVEAPIISNNHQPTIHQPYPHSFESEILKKTITSCFFVPWKPHNFMVFPSIQTPISTARGTTASTARGTTASKAHRRRPRRRAPRWWRRPNSRGAARSCQVGAPSSRPPATPTWDTIWFIYNDG